MQKRLRLKGWSDQELRRLHHATIYADKNRTGTARFVHNNLFWMIFFVAILVNLVIATVFFPLFLMLEDFNLLIALLIVGLGLGLVFQNLFTNAEKARRHHHYLMLTLIPTMSAIFVMVSASLANNFSLIVGIGPQHRVFTLGIAYGLSLFVPFFIKHEFEPLSK